MKMLVALLTLIITTSAFSKDICVFQIDFKSEPLLIKLSKESFTVYLSVNKHGNLISVKEDESPLFIVSFEREEGDINVQILSSSDGSVPDSSVWHENELTFQFNYTDHDREDFPQIGMTCSH